MRRQLALAALLFFVALLSAAAEPPTPRLVLVLAVDQLRADRLDVTLPGGLGRLAREGRRFIDAAYPHANTETCPGHATMLTGRHPGPAGVPLNDTVDRATGKSVYCAEDAAKDARVLGPSGDAGEGRSPRRLRVTTLGDWIKATSPAARVFSIAGKDRAAIMMGGQKPDAAYWYDAAPPGGFTTSRWYAAALPAWAERWHGGAPARDEFLASVPERWEHPTGAPPNGARIDDTPWEVPRFLRVSGHPLRSDDRKKFLEQVTFSPWLDALTLDFARALVKEENLGRGEGTDLLAIGLSATDTVGHLYGPGSQEARDALRRLDADLGRFLEELEKRVGKGRLLVVLTADHGVLELPEFLASVGLGTCPVAGGRMDGKALAKRLDEALRRELDPPGSEPHEEPWMLQESLELFVNERLATARGVPRERVLAAARAFLANEPGIERVWTREDVLRGADAFAALYRNSFDPERSGDLFVQTAPTCVLSAYPSGTSHGTPHLYDRQVPLVFFGTGVEPGLVRGRAAPVDIAPTLARSLGVATPANLDGAALPLASD